MWHQSVHESFLYVDILIMNCSFNDSWHQIHHQYQVWGFPLLVHRGYCCCFCWLNKCSIYTQYMVAGMRLKYCVRPINTERKNKHTVVALITPNCCTCVELHNVDRRQTCCHWCGCFFTKPFICSTSIKLHWTVVSGGRQLLMRGQREEDDVRNYTHELQTQNITEK